MINEFVNILKKLIARFSTCYWIIVNEPLNQFNVFKLIVSQNFMFLYFEVLLIKAENISYKQIKEKHCNNDYKYKKVKY